MPPTKRTRHAENGETLTKLGRPGLLTPLRRKAILAAAKSGLPQTTIARMLGISADTLGRWLREGARGRVGQEDYLSFYRDFLAAREAALREGWKNLKALGKKDYRATIYYLRHVGGPEFDLPEATIELEKEDGKPLRTTLRLTGARFLDRNRGLADDADDAPPASANGHQLGNGNGSG